MKIIKTILKIILFITVMVIVSMFIFNLYDSHAFVVDFIGIPAGIITAVLFLLIDYFYLKRRSKSIIVRLLLLLFIFSIVATTMLFGNDALYLINKSFKD